MIGVDRSEHELGFMEARSCECLLSQNVNAMYMDNRHDISVNVVNLCV